MISLQRKKFGLVYHQNLFARTAHFLDGLKFISYEFFIGQHKPKLFFIRHKKHTSLIDITVSDETLMQNMNKNTRSQIKKALNDGLIWEEEKDYDVFLTFYSHFTKEKGLSGLDKKVLESQIPFLFIGKITNDGQILVSHSYLVDKEEKRARYSSGGSIRLDKEMDTALIGRANRLAHFIEMQKLRELGIEIFDFGGYAMNTKDPQKQGINQFKESFGGKIVREDSFDSLLFSLSRLLKH